LASISFKSKKDNSKNYGVNSGFSYTPQYDYSQVAANPVSFKSQATPATQSGATADASKGGVIPGNTGNSGYGNTQFNPNQYVGNRVLSANNVSFGNNYNPNLAAGLKMNYNSAQPIYNLPQYYQQMGGYNAGLEAAKKKDADSGSGTNVYEKIYRITHQMPQAQTTDNSLSARMQRNLGDGSQLVNPNTDGSGYQWNVEKLKQVMGFDDTQVQEFMKNANLNWQSFNALKQAGAIELDPAHQQYQQYQDYQNQLSNQPQYYDDGSYSTGGYYDSATDNYPTSIANADQYDSISSHNAQLGNGDEATIRNPRDTDQDVNGNYNSAGELTPGGAFNNERTYLQNQLGEDYSPWTGI
jgi:hypothetical protein